MLQIDPRTDATVGEGSARAALCVLASGSRGNCSILTYQLPGEPARLALIDAGLSPRRTRRLLASVGKDLDQVDDVLVTHLDRDHFHAGWSAGLPPRARVHLHRRHFSRAERLGLHRARPRVMEPQGFPLRGGLAVRPFAADHDTLGVVAFRLEAPGLSIGFATDLGRVPGGLVDHLRGVDLLAIESNYCPRMQAVSDRPVFLKRRITGGAGHLSNEECLRAVGRIGPRAHVVLLHLSQECNTPERASDGHLGRCYALTVSSQHRPTAWVKVAAPASAAPVAPPPLTLFG